MIPIDKGIPLPPHGNLGVNRARFPFREMEVGDSFLHPGKLDSARRAAFAAARTHGGKFSARKTEAGVRIWRVA